ncbi:hypothetical protein SDC9_07414 [bioreactor metagenome]|uniref:Uncharacterized protein n=1 Tax=bioreactor metagenome TaxID=1076179 RepID=A0A644T4H4_9ZZZZ|nr:hypothetical protein [Methanobrevibacter sp.]MEA4956869.1 hypothetical protein [Methanobrevibacter sp.]
MLEKEFHFKTGKLRNITQLYCAGMIEKITKEEYYNSPPIIQVCYDIISSKVLEYQQSLVGGEF